MHRSSIALIGIAALSLLGDRTLDAQSASASLTVTASVSKNCTITTTPVSFGAYDPVVANATNPLDGTGTIVVACTRGANAMVGMNGGTNGFGTNRRMSRGAGQFLEYQLYTNAGRTDVWGDDLGGLYLGVAPSRDPRTFNVYGRVPARQDATVGSYTDTVVATVNF